jgi:hypothetical protein
MATRAQGVPTMTDTQLTSWSDIENLSFGDEKMV